MDNLKTNLDWALYYRSIGWSPFPVARGDKTPLVKWEKYQTEIATEEKIRGWWQKYPEASIGVATGKVSGIVVVDVEAGGDTKDLPATVVSHTGGGGFHFFYKYPNITVKNRVRIREKTDIRGDGGYVVVAPSLHRSGKHYEWSIAPKEAELEEFPRWILEKCAEEERVKTDWNAFLTTTNPEGTRNQQAAALAGKILYHNPIEMWDTVGWAALRDWNGTQNNPPLPEGELKATWESIKKAELEKRSQQQVPVDAIVVLPNKYLFTSLASLLDEPEEEIAWIVEGILPSGGFSMVAAKPKVGKSTLARQLALAIAQGVSFLGRQTTKGAVLYVALEEKRGEVKKHFRLLGATGSEDLYVYVGSVPHEAHKWLDTEIKRRKPTLVIIDTLFRFVSIADGNDYAKVTAALTPLLSLARDNGAHLMVIHHARKGGGEGGDTTLGSTAIFGSVDTAIMLKKTDGRRMIETEQRYGDNLPSSLLIFDEESRITTLGGTKEEDDLQRVTGEILSFFWSQAEPCTEKAVEEAIEGKTTLKRKALRDLLARGSVYRTGAGVRNDAYLYSCSLVPDIYAGREKQETGTKDNAQISTGENNTETEVGVGGDG